MEIKAPSTDYTNRDYQSLVESMLDLAALKLPEWTDRSANDTGRMLTELFAYTGDVLLYYQDRIANEAFLSTAVERRSVIDLLQLIGYTLATPAPAVAELQMTIPAEANDTTDPIQIFSGAKFATQALPNRPVVEFIYPGPELSLDRDGSGTEIIFYPRAENNEAPITVINATQIDNEVVGTSNGEANQRFRLRQTPVLLSREPVPEAPQDSDVSPLNRELIVEVDAGAGFQPWQRRETLLNSLSESMHYLVDIDAEDAATLMFGDGQFGQIPPVDSTIRVTYRIGGGRAGNVGARTITVLKEGVSEGRVTITNPQAASGGADRESLENARRQAPGVFRSLRRAVTREDYVALSENFPGVARANAVAPGRTYVDLYIVPQGFNLTNDLRARLLRYFEDKRMVTTQVFVRQPRYVRVYVALIIGISPTFYREDAVRRVEEALLALFEVEQLDFGQTLYLSKIFEAAEAIQGVDFVDVTQFQGTPQGTTPTETIVQSRIAISSGEFPRLGSLDITPEGGLLS